MFQDYIEHGWKLCAIEKGNKAPTYFKWNTRPIDEVSATVAEGAGLLHALSGTCALDIDNLPLARDWLAERGVDIDSLLEAKDAVMITSGRKNRAKLLYRLKTPLPTFKPTLSGVEFRCAGKGGGSMQDVLPPSVHPDTRKPYAWVYGSPVLGDWGVLPPLPASLLTVWRQLIAAEPKAAPGPSRKENADLERIQEWIDGKDPNMEYDNWLKVGAKLHDATDGADEGLDIWKEWSAKVTRKLSKPPNFKGHWDSFSSTPGKHVATLDNEMPATADEFEAVAEEAEPEATPEEKAKLAADVKANRDAQKKARNSAVQTLEERVVYVLASEKYFDTQRHRLIGSDSALEHQFTHLMPKVKGTRLNPVKVLKQSTTKRLVEGLGFHPGEKAIFKVGDDTYANMYRNRLPKPIDPTKLELEKIEWIFGRIEDEEYRWWLKQYYAHVVQHPAIKIKTAPLLWSEIERNGKSTLVKAIPALLVGSEFSKDASFDLLAASFNDYIIGAWHVNLTEFRANTRGDRTLINNKLKAYIADDTVAAHPKGGTSYTMPNHFFVTASSNEPDAAAISNNDERWGVYEFEKPMYTKAERQWIYREFLLQPRAAAALRGYFGAIDLTGFDPAAGAPSTESKREMAAASVAPDQELLLALFEERSEHFTKDALLVREVADYVRKHCIAKPTDQRVGKLLAKAPFNGVHRKIRANGGYYRVCIIRNHGKWKAAAGSELYAHINGMDDDLEFDILS